MQVAREGYAWITGRPLHYMIDGYVHSHRREKAQYMLDFTLCLSRNLTTAMLHCIFNHPKVMSYVMPQRFIHSDLAAPIMWDDGR